MNGGRLELGNRIVAPAWRRGTADRQFDSARKMI